MISNRWKIIAAALPIIGTLAVAQPQPGGLGEFFSQWYGKTAVISAFSPTDIDGLVGWWDASDAATLFIDQAGTIAATNNGEVLRFEDKSGNGRDLNNSSALPKVFYRASEQNGLGVLDFRDITGAKALALTNGLDIARNVGEVTMIMAQRWAGTGGTEVNFSISVGPNVNFRQQFRASAGILWAGARRLDADAGQSISGGVLATNDYFIQTARTDYQAQLHELWYNRTATASNTTLQTSGNTSDTDSQNVALGGSSAAATSDWDGWVAEVLVYTNALTDDELDQIWTYLENKWDIQ